jgi:hypothetical protein
MRSHGHTATWGVALGHTRNAMGWYQRLHEWWAARKAMRREARLAVMPLRPDAAADMVAPMHARSIAMALCDLSA